MTVVIENEIVPGKWKLYVSALIKAWRRSEPDDAVYWAGVLWRLGHEDQIWRRIQIHVSEDIGIAGQELPATIEALYQNFLRLKARPIKNAYEGSMPERMPLVHAVLLLATSSKQRCVDHGLICHFQPEIQEHREVPDYATDKHSPQGRRLGRGVDHFWEEASKLEPLDSKFLGLSYTWEKKAYDLLKAKEQNETKRTS